MRNSTPEISTADRRAQIIVTLDEKGQVDVQELSDYFMVSPVTIRNDLSYLEEKNLLYRTRGGAIKQTKVAMDLAFSEKARKNSDQKKRIGMKAAELVHEGDTIILDSGTTTMEIAKCIKGLRNLTVITHALNIASELAGVDGIEIIMPGGILRNKSFSLVGSQAEQNLRNFFCDKLFLGVDGLDPAYGISTPCASEAQLNRVMAEISTEVIVVADSSKFGKRSLALILPVNKIDKVITDQDITEEEKQKWVTQNVEIITA
ncbi:MAG TPA: transcriptional repressor AgaR [bacterium]|nr:transcriptional repressor AgaR [bacterium]HPN43571.1 transcriptional repressor AgaR [bacterium]